MSMDVSLSASQQLQSGSFQMPSIADRMDMLRQRIEQAEQSGQITSNQADAWYAKLDELSESVSSSDSSSTSASSTTAKELRPLANEIFTTLNPEAAGQMGAMGQAGQMPPPPPNGQMSPTDAISTFTQQIQDAADSGEITEDDATSLLSQLQELQEKMEQMQASDTQESSSTTLSQMFQYDKQFRQLMDQFRTLVDPTGSTEGGTNILA